MTPALQAEWHRHASKTMVAWLANMESRDRVRRLKDGPVRDLRNAIANVKDDGIRTALEKDIHLSEAAILHGLPVASQDDKQRKFLRGVAAEYALAGRVQWLNPVSSTGGWSEWIKGGCNDRALYCCAGQSA